MSTGKMRLQPKKRVEILVEAPLLRRVLTALDELGVPGYSLMDIVGGRGGGNAWAETDEIGNVSRMLCVISLVEPDHLESILTRIAGIIAGRTGVTAISDVEVIIEGGAFR
jgi:nitrogen regulatory protein PII